MSSRNQGYDSGESRRSPRSRSRSPPRYNEFRDEYRDRGSSIRGGERRRSISDSRSGPPFSSNREGTREPMGRGSRDFPPREPPRGPKALIDPPIGPRASNYGGDFRGDFGFRGDFRGGRVGRSRGRGGWRDDSRDRGREAERDYRGPRDDRGPPPFRDDRSRDRDRWDRNDSFRGRRQSSPQGRGRSPNYVGRESRDGPSTLDLDRARRGSRDGPLSGGSPASDSLQPFRGFGRGRGGRGRGRGGYYDDYHNRNPSPDPSWGRRTQPSATPPPQVPAFGSAATTLPVPPSAPKIPTAPAQGPPSGPALGTISGIPVPTAPRSQRPEIQYGRGNKTNMTSMSWVSLEAAKKEIPKPQLHIDSPSLATTPSPTSASTPQSTSKENVGEHVTSSDGVVGRHSNDITTSSTGGVDQPPYASTQKRRPIIGKRTPQIMSKESPQVPDHASDGSDSDSGDSIGRGDFFEEDMKKIEDQISRLPKDPDDDPLNFAKMAALSGVPIPASNDKENLKIWESELQHHKDLLRKDYNKRLLELTPLAPVPEPRRRFVQPFMKSRIDHELMVLNSANLQSTKESVISRECIANVQKEPPIPQPILEDKSASKPRNKNKSRPSTPLVESGVNANPTVNSQNGIVHPETAQRRLLLQSQVPVPSVESPVSSAREPKPLSLSPAVQQPATPKPVNGNASNLRPRLDTFQDSDGDEPPEVRLQRLAAVRKTIKTPPLSSLPTFDVKPWNQDQDFLRSLESDPVVEEHIRRKMSQLQARRKREQDEEGLKWRDRYLEYRRWINSDDLACIRSREKFDRARANAAAEVAAVKTSTPVPNAKPEPSRRGRFQTEFDLERVLRESEQEANEAKAREERSARARTASAKEATIPPMCWDEEEWQEKAFIDTTGIVPFERSFARLEFGEPVDNFTAAESEAFEKAFIEAPKQFTKIAEALPGRDYKACIQHYYLVKHSTGLKEKAKKQKRGRGRAKGNKKPGKPSAIDGMGDGEDEDNENKDGRRRPKRAAAPTWPFEVPPADSENASPAPTPGRRAAKGENGSDPPPKRERKTKTPREKVAKQPKNTQVLAAAPTPAARRPDSPPIQTPSGRSGSTGTNRFIAQHDGPAGSTVSFTPSPYPPHERNTTAMNANLETMSQTFPGQERDSATPLGFDSPDRRNPQHTSSYWSVPEQTDFPELLRHFGTDWHGIAKHMNSKTHIMVKNYFQRGVNENKSNWEEIAREADEKRQRGESTGPLPTPTIIPKTRGHLGSGPRMGSVIDGMEDMPTSGQNTMLQGSPTQPSMGTRFPALAQAGPVPQSLSQPATPTSLLNKHLPAQQSAPPPSQQLQQQVRPRGPALGYFNTDSQRPILQAANLQPQPGSHINDILSQRSERVAQEAEMERQQALRIQEREREQAQAQAQAQVQAQAQAQQQQAMQQRQQQQQSQSQSQSQQQQTIQWDMQRDLQRERQLHLKQEIEAPSLHQYEPYSTTPPTHASTTIHSRSDILHPAATQPDIRRTAPPQQYQPRNQAVRSLLSDNAIGSREIRSSPSPALPRAPMSAPPSSQEQYNAPPPSSAPPAAPPRQQEPRRSNLMNLLNDDEPSEPARPTPPKRVSDVASTTLQTSHTPPPQHPVQSSRYSGHNVQPISQPSQQMASHMGQQHQPSPHHPYNQAPQHSIHPHSSSIGQPRSYTPTSFEPRSYGPSQPGLQQQTQQQMYSQPPRQSMTSQAPPIRREPSHGELHSLGGGYAPRTSMASQSSSRLKESPYSASPIAPVGQPGRQQIASPLDLAQPSDRDYYSRQPPFHIQQQSSSANSPQLGPSYHPQAQQGPPSHRQLAFGQSPSHMASPPTQYATQQPLRSRHNSFDSGHRFPTAASSAPAPPQQGYAQAPQHQVHQGPPLPMQYQQQHPAQDRLENFEADRDRRIRQEEAYFRQRMDEAARDRQR